MDAPERIEDRLAARLDPHARRSLRIGQHFARQ
jgi:hypothetical protein